MIRSTPRPTRILHVLGGMNRGGVETWLMHVLRKIERQQFQFDFLTASSQPCAFDDEIRDLGCRIIPCLDHRQPWKYASRFYSLLRVNGPYDVVHTHSHHFCGFICRLARRAGVATRIAHSHNDTRPQEANAGLMRKLYLRGMKRLISRHATHGLACSAKAAEALFGEAWKNDRRWKALHYGIDLTPFNMTVDRNDVRSEFGISANAFVMGHVGRFAAQKNHGFLLDVVAAVVAQRPDACALLIGDGPLRSEMERKSRQLGIEKHVVFAGLRSDIPRLMLGALDVFLLPSLHEGLPVVSLEAQAAGLPCIFSDAVTTEADIVPDIVTRLPLTETAEFWSQVLVEHCDRRNCQRTARVDFLKNSDFDILCSVNALKQIYASCRI